MGYVESSLTPGDEVVVAGRLHWIIYRAPFSVSLLACGVIAAAAWLGQLGLWLWRWPALVLLALAMLMALRASVHRWSTEYAVTRQRVVLKTGFIRRQVTEFPTARVESVQVDQGILGRILGFGDVRINGSGGLSVVFPGIGDPVRFRGAILAGEVGESD